MASLYGQAYSTTYTRTTRFDATSGTADVACTHCGVTYSTDEYHDDSEKILKLIRYVKSWERVAAWLSIKNGRKSSRAPTLQTMKSQINRHCGGFQRKLKDNIGVRNYKKRDKQ